MSTDAASTKSGASGHLQSVVRFRPHLLVSDGVESAASPFSVDEAARRVGQMTFDHVFSGATSNCDVFRTCIQPTILPFLDGRNSCLLAYGQTGSGKTHSIFGWNDKDRGVVPLALEAIFNACHEKRRTTRSRVAVSFIEVYCEQVNDLLNPSTPSSDLIIRETATGACFVPNATVRIVHSLDAALELLNLGNQNKTIGSSYVHDKSSRSHTIFTLAYAGESNVRSEAASTVVARYSFVDLAGSEVLAEGFGAQQQVETKAINLSLLSLRGVVDALANQERHISYRDSALTRLLSQALSAKGSTIALCTCSPAAAHERLTAGTLRFADIAGRVKQRAELNVFLRGTGGGLQLKAAAVEESTKLVNGSAANAAGAEGLPSLPPAVGSRHTVNVPQVGPVSTLLYLPPGGVQPLAASAKSSAKPTVRMAVFLHAYGQGCDGADFDFLYSDLVADGYVVVAPDLPGFGQSPGSRQASRTDRLWSHPEGPLSTVEAVMAFATQEAYKMLIDISPSDVKCSWLVIGYDWGGNMALSLAVNDAWRPKITGLVLYHPSWTDKMDALTTVKTVPVLLCWVPSDQLHLISSGRKMAKHIPKSKLVSIVPEAGKEFSWAQLTAALKRVILPWLREYSLFKAPSSGVTPTIPPPAAAACDLSALSGLRRGPDGAGEQSVARAQVDGDSNEEELDGDAANDEMDDDDLATVSAQSSFLACLLADPFSTDALIAARSRDVAQQRLKAKNAAAAARLEMKAAALPPVAPSANAVQFAVHQLRAILSDLCSDVPAALLADALLKQGNGASCRPRLLSMIGHLPVLVPYARAETFVRAGLWKTAPLGLADLRACPRYGFGRRIFLPVLGVHTDFTNSATFGYAAIAAPTVSPARGFLTERCVVRGHPSAEASSTLLVDILSAAGSTATTVEVPVALADRWNRETFFPTAPGSDGTVYVFEDAIRANYADLVMRAKVAHCALAISDVVAGMDYARAISELTAARTSTSQSATATLGPANTALLEKQKAAITILRGLMNTTHHVQMGRDLARLCVPDCGRLATYGQWHCHGMACVFASMLLPFSSALGIAVRYRDGFFFSESRDERRHGWDGTPRRIADHTWLEVTCYPSGTTLVCDPSFTDQGEPILLSTDEAYSVAGRRCPMRDLTSRAPALAVHSTDAEPIHASNCRASILAGAV
jgi:pimeloyl-ACP methyl ester carboxylesterase